MTRRLIVEADGGSRGNPGPAAYGAVVRDATSGQVLAERAATLGVATNNVAEYRGLIAGLEAAHELDSTAFIDVRLDSKLVVEQMSGRWKIKHPAMQRLALEARRLVPADQVSYRWIPREQNGAADALVNAALDGTLQVVPDVQIKDADLGQQALQLVPEPAIPGWGPDLGPETTIYLIRHGVTAATAERRFSGSGGSDPQLSDRGQGQAAAAARALGARGGADVLVCSPLRRTTETAAAIANELGLVAEPLAGLRECAFGEWDGLTFAEVATGWPGLMREWLSSPDVAPPGGETLRQVAERVNAVVDQLRSRHSARKIVVVSHVTPIRVCIGNALDVPISAITRLDVPPASISTVSWWADGNRAVRAFADAAHT
ncbi:MAG: bifunctional RNase H/acid phosphatase [Actinomycetes bacterium]